MSEEIKGIAKDGTEFTAESEQVKAEMEAHPDLTLEAAIGNVVMAHDKAAEEEAPAEETEEVVEEEVEETPAEEETTEEVAE